MNDQSPTLMLTMTVEPELAERVADALAACMLPQGWHELAVEHAGGSAPYRSQRERVRGRRPRTQFQLLLAVSELPAVVAELDRRFGAQSPQRTIFPLLAATAG